MSVFQNYISTRKIQSPNVYHLETSVSDIKKEDFAKAVGEYKAKQVAKLERESREA